MIKPFTITHESGLSLREEEILSLMREGFTHKEIGSKLGVTLSTIRMNTRVLMAKLGAKTSMQAVIIAIRKGLLSINNNGI